MELEEEIKLGVSKVLQSHEIELPAQEVALQPTRKEFAGAFTFVTFPYAGRLRKSPEAVGQLLGEGLVKEVSGITGFNVVKGFLNLEINQSSWVDSFNAILADDNFGQCKATGENIMVEYSSPNTNKPLHLGHLRNNFLGYSISEIMKLGGHKVIKTNLVNDRGIHICKSMLAYEKFGGGETPKSSGLKGDHLIGKYYVRFDQEYRVEIKSLMSSGLEEEEAKKKAPLILEAQEMLKKWESGDEEVVSLWKTMNGWVYEGFDATYKMIGVDFDQYYYESETYLLGKDLVEEGLASGAFFKKDNGSVWCDLSEDGLDEKLVLRADGTSVYMTQDMGTADLKYKDYQLDRSIYVVGNEQDYHFQVLKLIMKKLGRPYGDGIYHLSYGMVDLPQGKMKSREGTVVDADDLIQEMITTAKDRTNELGKIDGFTEEEANKLYRMLALGALKYYILKVDPKKRMLFNPKESIDFQGDTGVFIQFTHARIAAILRKAEADGIKIGLDSTSIEINEFEQNLIELLVSLPKKIQDAVTNYSPSVLAQYAYSLAKAYSRFYTETQIFGQDNPEDTQFRVALTHVVGRTIRQVLGALGIESPTRM